MKVSFAEKKLLYFKASITFQSTVYQRKYYIKRNILFNEKKVIYQSEFKQAQVHGGVTITLLRQPNASSSNQWRALMD